MKENLKLSDEKSKKARYSKIWDKARLDDDDKRKLIELLTGNDESNIENAKKIVSEFEECLRRDAQEIPARIECIQKEFGYTIQDPEKGATQDLEEGATQPQGLEAKGSGTSPTEVKENVVTEAGGRSLAGVDTVAEDVEKQEALRNMDQEQLTEGN